MTERTKAERRACGGFRYQPRDKDGSKRTERGFSKKPRDNI